MRNNNRYILTEIRNLLTGNSMFAKFAPEILCSPQWPSIFHFGAETTKKAILAFVRHEAVVRYHTSVYIYINQKIGLHFIFAATHTDVQP